ncbi:hypothetical protein [Aeromonas sobria]|uniref:hypothetical protein n=1 Tax=Aeromonas sobria TaxID=646 RepID=UPI001119A9A8|nr:hypothetical protein [Aeromonas sobria]TNH99450.1 hypothetical protein CF137_01405 [Aeromonas sobria]
MNIERRVIGFIYHCFSFPSNIKAGGSMKYKCDNAYKRVMSSIVGREESAVYDLIYRYLIYKRGSLISSTSLFQQNIHFEDVCHYRFVGKNMLWQLVPINKRNDAFRLESASVDLERFDFFVQEWLPRSVGEMVYATNIYSQTLSQEDVDTYIQTVLSYFAEVLEKESYPIEGAFEKMPSIDTLSVVFINLMKISDSDESNMALRSNCIADIFFSLHGERLLLVNNNHLVGGVLQVLIDSTIMSALTDEVARRTRKKAIAAIIFGAEQLSLTAIDERLSNKLANLVYSDDHTVERLSKTVFSSIKSCWWFSELLASAKDKKEKVIYLIALLNSFSMTHHQIDDLLKSIRSANSTKRSKEQRSAEEVRQLTFDVTPAVRAQFERLYSEKRKLREELTRRQLITEVIEAEYRKAINVSRRKRNGFGIVFDKERDIYYPASVVSSEQTTKKNTKKSKSKFARRYSKKKR